MKWIPAKKNRYTASVHKLSEKEQRILRPATFIHIRTSNRNVSIMAPFSIRFFNSQQFYQHIHAYYLSKDVVLQGKNSAHCLFRCLKQFQYKLHFFLL